MNEIIQLDNLVTEIKFFEQQATQNYWEMGKRLTQAKEQIEHGMWGQWLADNFEFSQSTAARLIQIYKNNPNHALTRNLPLGHQFELLSIPLEEREVFTEQNNVSEMTQRELRVAIQENKKLKEKVEELSNQEPVIKEIVKEVIHPLYEKTKAEKDYLEIKLLKASSELSELRQKAKSNQEDSEKYQKLKKDIETLNDKKTEFMQQLKAIEHLAGLKTRLEQVFTTELLPINYHMDIRANAHSEQVLSSLDESLRVIEKWCSDMRQYLPNTTKGNYINV